VTARTAALWREQRLRNCRTERRAVYRAGGMSDRELFDEVNFLIAQCAPEQHEAKARLLDIAAELDLDEPDADAFRGCLGPVTLDSRIEA
jgi:hypothetical protein